MFPYYVLVLAPLLMCLLEYSGFFAKKTSPALPGPGGEAEKIKKRGITLFFFIFIVMLSLRAVQCGVDLKTYSHEFARYSGYGWKKIFTGAGTNEKELGYRLLNKIVSVFTDNFHVFMVIVAMVSVIPLWVLYEKDCEGEALTIAMFVAVAPFSMYFSGLRQVIAMAFAVPALMLTRKKKLLPFVLCVAAAVAFHFSAFIMIVMYPLYRAKITKNWLFAVVPAMALIFIFNRPIFSFLLGFLENTKYESYGTSETGAYGMLILYALLAAAILFITSDNADALSEDDIGYRNLMLLTVCLQMFSPLSSIAMRMNYYYLIFLPIAVPRLFKRASPKYKQIVSIGCFLLTVFFVVWFFYKAYTGKNLLQIYPYTPFWEGT